MTAVHQFLPSFTARSAVGNHTLAVRSLLHDLGLDSEVYVEAAGRDVARLARPFRSYTGRPGDVLLYQASTGSAMASWLLDRPEPLAVNAHNVTPVEMVAPWEPALAAELAAGRRQLADLAARASLGIAVSGYNRAELDDLGYRATAVVPVLVDTAAFDRAADPAAVARLRAAGGGRGSTWLFVGRLAPNKAQHHLIAALAAYRAVYDRHARLVLVGGASSPAYADALGAYRSALGLDDAVVLTGEVSDAELAAHYRAADVFVCASDHEGFCVPLLEALHHRLPVVAHASSAVPETLGDAGLCLPDKSPAVVAAAVHRVLTDEGLRAALAAAGAERLAAFALERTRAAFAAALAPLLPAGAVAGAAP